MRVSYCSGKVTFTMKTPISSSILLVIRRTQDSDQEEEEAEETFAVVTEAVREPTLKESISAAIKTVRKDVKFFRKSPKSNEFLQENIKKEFGKELKLILDVRTRWNSLYAMLERYVKVRMCVVKTLKDLALTTSVTE